MSHTPGPWQFDQDWHRLPTIFAADGKTKVAIIEKTSRDLRTAAQEADARLIAAAPSLLAALRAIVFYDNKRGSSLPNIPHMQMAREAVAAALGE